MAAWKFSYQNQSFAVPLNSQGLSFAVLPHIVHVCKVPPEGNGNDIISCYFWVGRSHMMWQTPIRISGWMGIFEHGKACFDETSFLPLLTVTFLVSTCQPTGIQGSYKYHQRPPQISLMVPAPLVEKPWDRNYRVTTQLYNLHKSISRLPLVIELSRASGRKPY